MTSLNVPLTGIAVALSGITAASVGMAIYNLIPDKLLGSMFASAAVLLDVYKYLSWPVADRLAEEGRRLLAGLMILCAVALGGVSGWATYDRLQGSMVAAEAPDGLDEQLTLARQRVAALDAEAAGVRQQAEYLRSRGMATPALALEEKSLPRIDTLRAEAQARVDRVEASIAARTHHADRSPLAATLLCLGFAVSLELVPVLAFLGVRKRRRTAEQVPVPEPEPVPEPLYDAGSAQQPAAEAEEVKLPQLQPEPVPEPPEEPAPKPTKEHLPEPTSTEIPEPAPEPAAPAQAAADDEALLQRLLDELAQTKPGTSMPVKKFARAAGIGNSKAGDIYQIAAERGALIKTNRGYVAA